MAIPPTWSTSPFSEGGRPEFPLLLVAARSASQSRCIARPIRAAVLCEHVAASARRGARPRMRTDRTTAMFPPYKTAAVADLVPYARNARTHSDAQVAQIAASHPRVRLHQPDPGRRRARRHRRPRPAAGRAQARPGRGADHRARPPHAGAAPRLRAGRQPLALSTPAGTRTCSGSSSASSGDEGFDLGLTGFDLGRDRPAADRRARTASPIRTRCRRSPADAGQPRRATSGCSAATAWSAATAPTRRWSSGRWPACGRT